MQTTKDIFIKRLKNELLFNYQVFKVTADWTVWLYLIIPLLLVIFYKYLSLWQGLISLPEPIPYLVINIILLFLSWTGNIRNFMQFADQLFLSKQKDWFNQVSKLGLIYSIINALIVTLFVIIILSPILIVYHQVSYLELFYIFIFTLLLRLNVMFIKQFVSLYSYGWKRFFLLIGLVILSSLILAYFTFAVFKNIYFVALIATILLFTFIKLYQRKILLNWSFNADCIREQEEKFKYAKTLLLVSSQFYGPSIPKSRKTKKAPWIFKNSLLIFKERNHKNGLIELYLKTVIRDKGNLLALIQISAGLIYGIIITPSPLKWLVWIFSIFMIINYLKGLFFIIEQNDFLKILPTSKISYLTKINAIRKSILYISLPSVTVLSFTIGLSLLSIWFGVILIFWGILINFLLISLLINRTYL